MTTITATKIAAARTLVPELAAEVERLAAENRELLAERHGPYRCCEHCTDDPVFHAENQPHTHEISCSICDEVYQRRAAKAEAENAELRAKVERVRKLHYPADNDSDRTPVCPDCRGRAGVHPCGCWSESDRSPVCGHCREGWKGASVAYPCPTLLALDGEQS